MLQLTSVKKDIGKNARSCSGIDNNFRMPFFDNWLLGFLKNERNITMIARSEGTGELMGLVIMEVLPSQSKETATKMKTPRYLECPDKVRRNLQVPPVGPGRHGRGEGLQSEGVG